MAKLNIYLTEKNEATISQFGKPKDNDKITFHNKHSTETLTVSIQGEPGAGNALCKGSQEVPTFTVTPGEKKKSFSVCDAYQAETFKYTATIGQFDSEDPIIIIERGKLFGTVPVLLTAVIAVAAFTLGVAVAKGLGRRKAPTPT